MVIINVLTNAKKHRFFGGINTLNYSLKINYELIKNPFTIVSTIDAYTVVNSLK